MFPSEEAVVTARHRRKIESAPKVCRLQLLKRLSWRERKKG
jgi:hypothetical protein